MSGLAQALRRVRREALSPPPLLSLSAWAAPLPDCRRVKTPCRDASRRSVISMVLDAITDPAVRMVTVMKSARVGYTRCLDHAVGYFIHQDPSAILMVLPRVEDCEDFQRSEILPMLIDTPVLAEITGDIKIARRQSADS